MDKVFDSHVHVGRHHEWIPEGRELAIELADERAHAILEHDQDIAVATAKYLREEGVTYAGAIPAGRQALQESTVDYAKQTDDFFSPSSSTTHGLNRRLLRVLRLRSPEVHVD